MLLSFESVHQGNCIPGRWVSAAAAALSSLKTVEARPKLIHYHWSDITKHAIHKGDIEDEAPRHNPRRITDMVAGEVQPLTANVTMLKWVETCATLQFSHTPGLGRCARRVGLSFWRQFPRSTNSSLFHSNKTVKGFAKGETREPMVIKIIDVGYITYSV